MILSCVLCNKKIDFYPLVFPDRGVKVLCVRKNFHYNFVLGSMEDYLKCRSLKVFKYLIHASDRVSGRFFFQTEYSRQILALVFLKFNIYFFDFLFILCASLQCCMCIITNVTIFRLASVLNVYLE